MKLSVIIIAKNEEEMIKDCLESVKWADEIVFIDTGSKDKTPQIAKKYTDRLTKLSWKKFEYSKWRNVGLEKASGDWVFYLDADERVTLGLKKEILLAMKENQYNAYQIPRRNFYLGQEVRFGGAWPDYVKRFFKRKSLKKWERDLHEDPVFEGEMGTFKEPMIHLTHRDLTSMLEKTISWSKIEAELLYQDYPGGHPPMVWWRFLRVMLTEFWHRGVKLQGWRDGTVGWIEIIFQMFSRFITYARLWELQNKS